MDALTILAAQRGDRAAQARLLRELQDPWFRTCLGLLGDPDRAREATQEAAARFLRLLPTFRGESQLRTWATGIAINVTREMRRAVRPTVALNDGAGAASDADGASSPEHAAEQAERRAFLHATLALLPQRQREAVVLRYFEDLSMEDTAQAMQCAVGTVKATVHQALKAMKERLKQLV